MLRLRRTLPRIQSTFNHRVGRTPPLYIRALGVINSIDSTPSSHFSSPTSIALVAEQEKKQHPNLPSQTKEIQVGNGSALWLGQIYRFGHLIDFLRWFFLPLRWTVYKRGQMRKEQDIKDAFSEKGHHVIRIVSQLKEGGCYVVFYNQRVATLAKQQVTMVKGKKMKASVVLGVPFIEDIVMRRPTLKLKITFPDNINYIPTEDKLFALCRQYGHISSLVVEEKIKDKPAVVSLIWFSLHSAIRARNCLHNLVVKEMEGAGRLSISFERYSRFHKVTEIMKNPRMIPLAALIVVILVILTVAPLRLVKVTQNMAMNWHEKLDHKNEEAWIERPEQKQLEEIFRTRPSAVTIITGPKGAGKTYLLKKALDKRRFVARIDCSNKDFLTVGGQRESAFIENLQDAIGFTPSFSAINTLFSYVETLLPTKSSHAMTTTQQSQLKTVLSTLDKALRIVSTTYPSNPKKKYDYSVIVFDAFHSLVQSLDSKSSSEKEKETAQMLLDALTKWSIECTQVNHTAHIVFVTDSAYTVDQLNKADRLRGRIKEVRIDDLPKSDAFNYLATHIQAAPEDGMNRMEKGTQQQKNPFDEEKKLQESEKYQEKNNSSQFSVWSILSNLKKITRKEELTKAVYPTQGEEQLIESAEAIHENKGNGKDSKEPSSASPASSTSSPQPSSETASGRKNEKEETYPMELIKAINPTLSLGPKARAEIKSAVDFIGGRMTDLASLIQRTKHGRNVPDAIADMLKEAERDLLTRGFGSKLFLDATGKTWTQSQLWKTVKLLVQEKEKSEGKNIVSSAGSKSDKQGKGKNQQGNENPLAYSSILYSVFEGDEEALKALVSENILTFAPYNDSGPENKGGAYNQMRLEDRIVVAGSPLLYSAFQLLVKNEKFHVMMDNLVYKNEMKKYKQEIDEIEQELVRLQEAKYSPGEVRSRLETKLKVATANLKVAEEKVKKL